MPSFLQRPAPAHARLVRAGLAVAGLGALCAACAPVEYTQAADCRQFVQPITVNGTQETRYTTQCRQADGSWRVIAQSDSGTAQTAQAGQTAQGLAGQPMMPATLPPAYPYNPGLYAVGAPYPYPYGYYDSWPGYYGPGYGLGFFGGFGYGYGFRGRGWGGYRGGGFHGGMGHGGGGHGGGGHR
jgi:hypothetical protein